MEGWREGGMASGERSTDGRMNEMNRTIRRGATRAGDGGWSGTTEG